MLSRFIKPQRLLPIIVLAAGCASPYLYTKKGTKPGETVTGVAFNALSDVKNFDGWEPKVYLSPQRIVESNGASRLQMVVLLTRGADDYILVKPGRSLKLDVDGKQMSFSTRLGSGPRRSLIRGSLGEKTLSESAIYDKVSLSDIKIISEAKSVDVTIIGRDQTVTARFSETNFAAFQALVQSSASDNPQFTTQ